MPSPLDYVGRRRFAFYPPIGHADPNEWLLGVGARSEVQVVNAHTGREIWVSRQYIGAVSETSTPLLIVGLTKALDFREGTVEPRVKQIIEMPPASKAEITGPRVSSHSRSAPAPVIEIRLESRADSTLTKAMFVTCICAIVLALLAALVSAAIRF